MNAKPMRFDVSFPSISTTCAKCRDVLSPSDRATREHGAWICLKCADLDHLVYLPAGNTALTSRATKHSILSAVVYSYSKARKRNERIGTLVEEAALAKAETECVGDEEARALARERAAARREKLDAKYVNDFAEHIKKNYPGCPAVTRVQIAEHACEKHSGRVGRSAAAKQFELQSITLAVRAHVRHRHTRYDRLLGQGCDREMARMKVDLECEKVLGMWKKPEEYNPPELPDDD